MVKPVYESNHPDEAPSYFVNVSAGDFVFRHGDPGDEMFIIQEGEVEIVQEHSGDEVTLAVLRQGDFFGEMAILEAQPRTASARATADCNLLPIKGSTFDEMLQKNPEVAVRMMRKLSGRLRQMEQYVRDFMDSQSGEAAAGSPLPPEPAPAEAPPTPPTPPEAPPAPEPPAAAEEPPAAEEKAAKPRLEHEGTDHVFDIAAEGETTVGRPDAATGTTPGIDLTPVNDARTISRRHARIVSDGGKFFVVEEVGATNGVTVNGTRVGGGERVAVVDGDKVDFGAVKTTFKL
ncbi:MAG: cyclic nucleotide-binding domain-containing protein [Acidobacteriota bacterium]